MNESNNELNDNATIYTFHENSILDMPISINKLQQSNLYYCCYDNANGKIFNKNRTAFEVVYKNLSNDIISIFKEYITSNKNFAL